MRFDFATLDVFTNRRFAGNGLAVVLDADPLTTEQMQAIAREFNLSETIFVMKPADPAHTARVRIFFPTGEIPFAGHPTLGCAIFLAEQKYKPGCSFETLIMLEEVAGLVPVKISRIGDVSTGVFTAPIVPHAAKAALPSPALAAKALSLNENEIGFGAHCIGAWQGGPTFLFVPVKSRDALARCTVSEPSWSEMTGTSRIWNAYAYTAGGDHAETNYRARMFAPAAGVSEDPATGSATALLAAQLLASKELADGKTRLKLEQGYEMGRPSDLVLEADVAGGQLTAVRVGGQAVQVMEGSLEV